MPEITDDIFAAQSQGVTPVFGLFGDYQDEQRSPKEMAYANRFDSVAQPATAQPEAPKYQFSPENSLLELMNTKLAPPDPEAQAKAEKRLRNRTLFDAAGRLFTNIGDSMTLGFGGIPIKRAPSETDKKMMDYYKKIEEGLKANEDFKKEDFTRKLQSYGLWNQAKNQDRSFAQGEDQFNKKMSQDQYQFEKGLGHDEKMLEKKQGFEAGQLDKELGSRENIAKMNNATDKAINDAKNSLQRYMFNQERGIGNVDPGMEKMVEDLYLRAKNDDDFVGTFPNTWRRTTQKVVNEDGTEGTITNVDLSQDMTKAGVANNYLEFIQKKELVNRARTSPSFQMAPIEGGGSRFQSPSRPQNTNRIDLIP